MTAVFQSRDYDPAEWMDRAACTGVGVELFFPEKGQVGATAEARKVCRRCPVRVDCLEYALAFGEKWGIWGGHTEAERRIIRRQRERLPMPRRRVA